MTRYWVISPYDKKDTRGKSFEQIWQYDLTNGTIALGSSSLHNKFKDLSILSQETLENEIKRLNPGWSERKICDRARTLYDFYYKIQEGDFVLAKDGKKRILAIGKAVSRNGKVCFTDIAKLGTHPSF